MWDRDSKVNKMRVSEEEGEESDSQTDNLILEKSTKEEACHVRGTEWRLGGKSNGPGGEEGSQLTGCRVHHSCGWKLHNLSYEKTHLRVPGWRKQDLVPTFDAIITYLFITPSTKKIEEDSDHKYT